MSQAPLPSWSAPPRRLRRRNGADVAMGIAAAGVVEAVGVMVADMVMAAAMATTAVTSVPVAGGPRVVFAFAAGNNRRPIQAILKTSIRCVGSGAPDFLLGLDSLAAARLTCGTQERAPGDAGALVTGENASEIGTRGRAAGPITQCIYDVHKSRFGCLWL